MSTDDALMRQSLDKIETARKQQGISVREATGKVRNISEGYWRQFVAGGVRQSGVWVPKTPTPEQLLKMAVAVGIGNEIADDLGLFRPEPAPDEIDAAIDAMRAAIAELERIKRDRAS